MSSKSTCQSMCRFGKNCNNIMNCKRNHVCAYNPCKNATCVFIHLDETKPAKATNAIEIARLRVQLAELELAELENVNESTPACATPACATPACATPAPKRVKSRTTKYVKVQKTAMQLLGQMYCHHLSDYTTLQEKINHICTIFGVNPYDGTAEDLANISKIRCKNGIYRGMTPNEQENAIRVILQGPDDSNSEDESELSDESS
jgi:hypothetical protein